MELKDLPWECVAEEPKEPESWEELYELIGPRSWETRETFFENIDQLIPYYVAKIRQFRFREIHDVIGFCRCVSRIIPLLSANPSKLDMIQIAFDLSLLKVIGPIQILEEELGCAYSSLVLNTVVALYSDEQTRDEAIRLLLENRQSILGKIDEFDENFHVSYNHTLSVIIQILMDRIEDMEPEEQKQWVIILIQLIDAAHYFNLDSAVIAECFSFAAKAKKLRIPEEYQCLIQLTPYLLSDERDEEERQLPREEAEWVFSTFKKLVRKFSQQTMQEIGEKCFENVLEGLFFSAHALKDGKILGGWIETSNLPQYKKTLLGNRAIWRIQDLFNAKQYKAIVTLHQSWLDEENREFAEKHHLFELAYSYFQEKDTQKSRELYERYLQIHGDNAAVYNNLGVIFETENNFDLALHHYQRACEMDPIELHQKNLKRIQSKIKEREKRPKLLRDRYFKTDKTHKRILFSIYNLSGEGPVTEERLQEVAGFGTKLSKLLRDLMQKELVHWDRENGYSLDPAIVETVKAWVDPQLQAQIIKHSRNKLYKPIFFHESEYRLYRVLVELFPQHLIFPNMALQSIIDYEKLKEHVESDVFEYYLKTHVDFAVIDTTTYLPLILFEKDSEYHDEGRQLENTKKKNLIFQVAGLPLVRLRFNKNMDEARLKEEVKQVTKELLSQLMHSDNDEDQRILSQFDLKAFGIHRDPLDLDAVHALLKERLGDTVYEHIEVNWQEEDRILVLKVPSSFKPILELGADKLREELYQRFPMINRMDTVWV